MVSSLLSLREDYWQTFSLEEEDIEFLYNDMLEKEIPQTSAELTEGLVTERIRRERDRIERKRSASGVMYTPEGTYDEGQNVVFPALGWRTGKVIATRDGFNPELNDFKVIQVAFSESETREFATNLAEHILNDPVEYVEEGSGLIPENVLSEHALDIEGILEKTLVDNPDFVRIADKWFPRGLLVDINAGHLNLTEAVLDMAGGGPLATNQLMSELSLSDTDNKNLTEFSLALAMQEDPRFDEVGPAGEVLWFLNRLEPEGVLKPHAYLRYVRKDDEPVALTEEMIRLVDQLEDELSDLPESEIEDVDEVQIPIIFPHWRAGTLPLSRRISKLFPTAYEAPRIRFMLVDGETDEKFPGWVVRNHKYVYGLSDWYEAKGIIPGSIIRIRRSSNPGEVVVECNAQRSSRDWIRTVLVGSDGGIVFAMLKQTVTTAFDDRMTIAVPDVKGLDLVWENIRKNRVPFERSLVNIVRELSKLNPQSHVHASELYAAVNIIRRSPPGPILSTLSSGSQFVHVGDLHFRFDDSDRG